jgi:peptidoglycan/LPS O-acetylase OafA/YrhL
MLNQFELLRSYLSRPNIPAFDGLRAVAVFLVIGYHFGLPGVPGAHGVLNFFVLSGFLITWLLLKENERTGGISLSAFYRRRILRIFPAFYVYWFLLVGLLVFTGRAIHWPHAWSSFFYVTNYYNAINGDPNDGFSHTWSLAIEEQFYLLWPLALLLLRNNLVRCTKVLLGIIGTVWIYRVILVYGFDVRQSWLFASFDTRVDSLMMGCLLAVLMKRGVLESFWRRVLSWWWAPIILLALLGLSVFDGKLLIERYRDVVGFAIEPVLMALLMAIIVAHHQRWWWRWLSWSWVKYLGRISYSLYLYQQITLDPVRKALHAFPEAVQFAAAVIVTVIVASVSYWLVERTFQRFRGRPVHDDAGKTETEQVDSHAFAGSDTPAVAGSRISLQPEPLKTMPPLA